MVKTVKGVVHAEQYKQICVSAQFCTTAFQVDLSRPNFKEVHDTTSGILPLTRILLKVIMMCNVDDHGVKKHA